jgi:hypothetical protein
MMYGVVNLRREATLPVVVGNANRQQQLIQWFGQFLERKISF